MKEPPLLYQEFLKRIFGEKDSVSEKEFRQKAGLHLGMTKEKTKELETEMEKKLKLIRKGKHDGKINLEWDGYKFEW